MAPLDSIMPLSCIISEISEILVEIAIFTARRVCTARTMPWQDVCRLSVRHTPVFCQN